MVDSRCDCPILNFREYNNTMSLPHNNNTMSLDIGAQIKSNSVSDYTVKCVTQD